MKPYFGEYFDVDYSKLCMKENYDDSKQISNFTSNKMYFPVRNILEHTSILIDHN